MITILGKPYVIERIDALPDQEFIGQVDSDDLVIKIVHGLKPDVYRETLLHETIHAISDELGLNLNENQVQCLSVALYAVYRENGMELKFTAGGGL